MASRLWRAIIKVRLDKRAAISSAAIHKLVQEDD